MMKKTFLKVIAVIAVLSIVLSSSVTAFAAGGRWIKSGSRWWYRHNDSSYTSNGWEKINNKWYYFDASGWMKPGWVKYKGEWYYNDKSGAMQTGWKKISGKWYHFSTSYYGFGEMDTGWFDEYTDGGYQIYYLKSDGSMATGWTKIKDYSEEKWYYFDQNGIRGSTQWINGYYINNSGLWEEHPGLDLNKKIKAIRFSYEDPTKFFTSEYRGPTGKGSTFEADIQPIADYLKTLNTLEFDATLKRLREDAATWDDHYEYGISVEFAYGTEEHAVAYEQCGILFCEGVFYEVDFDTFTQLFRDF